MEIHTLVRGERIKLELDDPRIMITCLGYVYMKDDNWYYKSLEMRKFLQPVDANWEENSILISDTFKDKKKVMNYIREKILVTVSKNNKVTISLDKKHSSMWKDILEERYNKNIFKSVQILICTPEEYRD